MISYSKHCRTPNCQRNQLSKFLLSAAVRIHHLIRMLPTEALNDVLNVFDEKLLLSFMAIFRLDDSEVTERMRLQIQDPVGRGFGIRSVSNIALCAYFASFAE